jgi:hypothetical protein
MRGASFLLGIFVVAIASAAACAEGDSPGFENVGGGGGASGDGGSGEGGDEDDDDDTSGSRASATTGPTSTSAVTSVSSTGSATTTSTTTTTTSTGAGGSPPCQDTGLGEPSNDEMSGAYNLGTQPDSDGDERTIAGVLQTPDDVDWYFYLGEDNFGSTVDPGRQIIGAGIRICKYIECVEGDAEFECPSGTQADEQGGRPGCCWTDNEPLEWGLNCNGPVSDDARVYMRVDHVGGPGCESYSLKFNY